VAQRRQAFAPPRRHRDAAPRQVLLQRLEALGCALGGQHPLAARGQGGGQRPVTTADVGDGAVGRHHLENAT
jgi:hypothetical protein